MLAAAALVELEDFGRTVCFGGALRCACTSLYHCTTPGHVPIIKGHAISLLACPDVPRNLQSTAECP